MQTPWLTPMPPFSSLTPPVSWPLPPPPPPPSDDSGIFIVRLVIAFAFSLFAVFLCTCCNGYRNGQARAAANAAAERQRQLEPGAHNGELQVGGGGATNTAARLPAFKYNRSVKHNVTGAREEAATCSVCLGAFQLGETVRLLPVCLHLYHAECIDPWLDAHTTCPICRSDTDPTMGVGQPPPV